MLNFKRKSIVISSLAALLLLTGILQYRYSQSLTASAPKVSGTAQATAAPTASPVPAAADAAEEETGTNGDVLVSSDFFPSYKLQRQSTRDEEVQYLQSIIDNENTDAATRKTAQEQLLTLTANMEKELLLEGLLEAKGFVDVITTLHTDSVNVVVGTDALDEAQVAQIYDVVVSQAGVEPGNIKIITAMSQDATGAAVTGEEEPAA